LRKGNSFDEELPPDFQVTGWCKIVWENIDCDHSEI